MKNMILISLLFSLIVSACQSGTQSTPENTTPVTEQEIPQAGTHVVQDTVAPVEKGVDDYKKEEYENEGAYEDKAMSPSSVKIQESSAAPESGSSGAPGRTDRSVTGPPNGGIVQNGFQDVTLLDPTLQIDIRYATTNNFTKSKIYDCPRCLLRPEAAEAIVKANYSLKKKGLSLKMFDCYRPRPYQQRLWDKVPNPDYVTPPNKGSMHSRGAAVDLTIVDAQGNELDMGTPYDFFGEEAHTDFLRLPANVLENRALLRNTLEAVGFKGIRTEWWHFSYQKRTYALSDYLWPCPGDK